MGGVLVTNGGRVIPGSKSVNHGLGYEPHLAVLTHAFDHPVAGWRNLDDDVASLETKFAAILGRVRRRRTSHSALRITSARNV